MDNPTASWAPRAALVGVGWLLAALSAAAAVLTGLSGDRAGPVLFGVAALALAGFAANGSAIRPKLSADAHGVRVRTLTGDHRLEWSQVRVRLVKTRRLGREVPTLEIECEDIPPHLLVLGWLELGTDPRDVLDVLSALRARG
ncbi:PH domain-containing protein [Amycolatopsis sp. 195334CR]|uniref:PH domain-containing protein n=1 Tax=Amycolatopsis sp. 195334CR TaxID=2814588 RepID=UPI001A8E9089|nr:PH domain-containing protein [Amycolatopsis sp. 195334CR]MBN6035560.1 PH domain-containing protein [Amycolatopsis sp. 195334CR]